MELQRALAEEIARQPKAPLSAIEEREGEVADQPVERLRLPLPPGSEQDRGVREPPRALRLEAKRGCQLGAIIDANVGDERITAGLVDSRTDIEIVLGERMEETPAERDSAVLP